MRENPFISLLVVSAAPGLLIRYQFPWGLCELRILLCKVLLPLMRGTHSRPKKVSRSVTFSESLVFLRVDVQSRRHQKRLKT